MINDERNLFELKDYKEFNNILIDPPDSESMSPEAISDWLLAHGITINVYGKVIILPYNADNVSELKRFLTVCAKAEDGEPTPANTKICCGDVLSRILNKALDELAETKMNPKFDTVYKHFYNETAIYTYLYKGWIDGEEFDALYELWNEDKTLFNRLRMEAIKTVLYSSFEADYCEENDRTTLFFFGRKWEGEFVHFLYGTVWTNSESWDEYKDEVVREYLSNMFGVEAF